MKYQVVKIEPDDTIKVIPMYHNFEKLLETEDYKIAEYNLVHMQESFKWATYTIIEKE